MKKIGIIGSGVVGKTLASGFLKHGYQVMVGSRDTSKLQEWFEQAGANASLGNFAETAQFGELLVLAVRGSVAESALSLAGEDNLASKTIMDATNPISDEPPANGVLNFFTEQNSSLMEQLQDRFPGAHFVKAFNSVGSALMVNPALESKPTMFICGNNEEAKREVAQILDQFGWLSENCGAVEAARAIEPLCMLWCIPGFRENRWTHAFKLLELGR